MKTLNIREMVTHSFLESLLYVSYVDFIKYRAFYLNILDIYLKFPLKVKLTINFRWSITTKRYGAMGLRMLGRRQVKPRWANDPVWLHRRSIRESG